MSARYTKSNFSNQTGTDYMAAVDANAEVCFRTAAAFTPSQAETPDMTVRVEAGALLSGSTLTEVAAQNTSIITAPAAASRIDRVVINRATGAVSVITGAEGYCPSAPAFTADVLPIAQVALSVGQTSITNADITDERICGGSGDMLRANNLSDVMDVASARENLGLGTAALLDAGTAAGNVVQLDADGKLPTVLRPDIRTRLTADTTFHVASTGSDTTGDGSATLPWATLQHARDSVQRNCDLCGHKVYYSATGSFSAGIIAYGPLMGQRSPNDEVVLFTAGAVVTAPAGGRAFDALYGAKFAISQPQDNLTVRAFGTGSVAFAAADGGFINILNTVTIDLSGRDGHAHGDHALSTSWGGIIIANSTYAVGDMETFLFASGGLIQLTGNRHDVLGTPTYSKAFAWAHNGTIGISGQFVAAGVVTGRKYLAEMCGVISTCGGGPSYLPGSLAGIADPATFGVYV